ncbi:hypothetical protein [Saccharopolyspora pogona]|nr:hypothetical protein [Saccharopolyspora pogona]
MPRRDRSRWCVGAGAAHLHVLATSREPLRLAGEGIVAVLDQQSP